MLLMVAMGPPGGGRNMITARLLSRFSVIAVTFPNDAQIQSIFTTMLKQHLSYKEDLMNHGKYSLYPIVNNVYVSKLLMVTLVRLNNFFR